MVQMGKEVRVYSLYTNTVIQTLLCLMIIVLKYSSNYNCYLSIIRFFILNWLFCNYEYFCERPMY